MCNMSAWSITKILKTNKFRQNKMRIDQKLIEQIPIICGTFVLVTRTLSFEWEVNTQNLIHWSDENPH